MPNGISDFISDDMFDDMSVGMSDGITAVMSSLMSDDTWKNIVETRWILNTYQNIDILSAIMPLCLLLCEFFLL